MTQSNAHLGFALGQAFCQSLPAFFERLTALEPLTPTAKAQRGTLLQAAEDPALHSDYEALFYGTRWGVTVPLWASASKAAGPVLWDATTLSVIQFYHRWGHQPPDMESHPPDFLGNQFAFLAYLQAARTGGGESPPLTDAMEDFTQQFLLDTVMAMAEGAHRCGLHPALLGAAALLEAFVASGFDFPFSSKTPAPKGGLHPPLPDAPESVVRTAGINNCGGRCAIHARQREGCVLEVTTDCGGRTPQLRACVRGRGYRRTFLTAQRLRYPMKRVGKRGEGQFARITWREAVDTMAAQWRRITAQYGPASRYVQVATGNEAVLRGDHMLNRLLNMDGGQLGRYGSYSAACVSYIMPYVYGDNRGQIPSRTC